MCPQMNEVVNSPKIAVGGTPLGINAKSSTPPQELRQLTQGNRAKRYALLSTARSILMTSKEAQALQYPMEIHRTCKCAWLERGASVNVHKTVDQGKAFYSQLVTCGSVSTCPVCAAKIEERRREEIALAIDWAYRNGLQCALVTLTFPHTAAQRLADLLSMQADALRRLRAGAPWQRIKDSVDFQGLIRGLETTVGDSGWHPHTHEIWMIDKDADVSELFEKVRARWLKVCIRAGLVDPDNERQKADFLEHSVDIKGAVSCSEYLAKMDDSKHWGVDREVAKRSTKTGKRKGVHPFGLLEIAAGYREGESGRAARLFREYAEAMKGKRLLFWSHGLKERVGIEDKTDEVLAEESREAAVQVSAIPRTFWRLVRQSRTQSHVLDLVEDSGASQIRPFLEFLLARAKEADPDRWGGVDFSDWNLTELKAEDGGVRYVF